MTVCCIYHGNCADGFGAAWAVHHMFRGIGMDIEYHQGVYQTPPPDVVGKDILLVDFSYKRPVLLEMAKIAKSVTILDHHESARDDLAGFPVPTPEVIPSWLEEAPQSPQGEIKALFDMDRSGAGITWDFFHTAPRPDLINHIEDRDLWKFELPGTREIQAAVFSYPYDFAVWDILMLHTNLGGLRKEGAAIKRKDFKDIHELLKVVQREMTIGGHRVPVASLPYTLTSDAGHIMAGSAPFAACYWDTADNRIFSLRSREDGMNVADIAITYGGEGHAHAAGFSVPRNHELAQI